MTTTMTTTTPKTPKRRLSQIALALAPFVLLAIGARALVPRVAAAMARAMAGVASWALIPSRVPQAVVEPTGEDSARVAPETLPRAAADAAACRKAPAPVAKTKGAGTSAVPRRPAAIFIPSENVLNLAPRELRGVRGTTVVNESGRRTGVRLSGVGVLGVGLADGDVVTTIDGRPTPTVDDATAAGMTAWSAGMRAIHATIVRGSEIIAVTVEIPVSCNDARGSATCTTCAR